jgi:hypothetical protein
MTLSNILIACGLSSRATPTGSLNTAKATIGTQRSHALTLPNRVWAVQITSAATGNVATLTVPTGDCAQTTGSPVIIGAGDDFQGTDLGTATKICGLSIRTSGTGTVTLAGTSSGLFPAQTLQSGTDIVIKFPDLGATLAGTETITATFSAAAGVINIEALSKV